MNLAEKISKLRKEKGWTQEELADRLNVSRQAVSRWENGSALPDAQNILQLSKLFGVTTDYLLHDDYENDGDIPIVRDAMQKTEDVICRKKRLHLVAAGCFTFAALCGLMGILTSTNDLQQGLSCFSAALCAANAVAQTVLFFKK